MDKLEAYLVLYKTQMNKFKQTQNIQWKVNLSIWTVILVGGAYLMKEEKIIIMNHPWIFIATLTIVHWYWSWIVQKSLELDKALFIQYRELAEIELKINIAPNNTAQSRTTWWPILFSLVTAGLLFFIFYGLNPVSYLSGRSLGVPVF